jgi:Holliday junction resolvasome RuvABC DNA-binding subunit
MAEKIILEMKDKDFWINIHSKENIYKTDNLPPNLHSSIKSTLANMWYNPKDIDRVLWELPDEMVEASKIIPFVIRNLS